MFRMRRMVNFNIKHSTFKRYKLIFSGKKGKDGFFLFKNDTAFAHNVRKCLQTYIGVCNTKSLQMLHSMHVCIYDYVYVRVSILLYGCIFMF
jgi:hypothetical protein